MELIADGLLIAAAVTAAAYCMILSSRLRRLNDLDRGVGGAIAQLNAQIQSMQSALEAAKRASGASSRDLRELTARAEMAAGRLELLLASLHDQDGARPVDAARRRARAEPSDGSAEFHEAVPPAGNSRLGELAEKFAPKECGSTDHGRAADPAVEDPLRRRLRAIFDAKKADKSGESAA